MRLSLLAVGIASLAVASANTAFAQALNFSGWTNYGGSNAQGTWIMGGAADMANDPNLDPYNIYTR